MRKAGVWIKKPKNRAAMFGFYHDLRQVSVILTWNHMIYTWKTILLFLLVKTHFSSFFVDYGFLPSTLFFQPTGPFFFSTTCWTNTGLLRVSASTLIKYEPKYAYGDFFGTLRGFPIIDQKKCQYGFSGIFLISHFRRFESSHIF